MGRKNHMGMSRAFICINELRESIRRLTHSVAVSQSASQSFVVDKGGIEPLQSTVIYSITHSLPLIAVDLRKAERFKRFYRVSVHSARARPAHCKVMMCCAVLLGEVAKLIVFSQLLR